jgi:hypothetical protein
VFFISGDFHKGVVEVLVCGVRGMVDHERSAGFIEVAASADIAGKKTGIP